jgi:hypothetical protein
VEDLEELYEFEEKEVKEEELQDEELGLYNEEI